VDGIVSNKDYCSRLCHHDKVLFLIQVLLCGRAAGMPVVVRPNSIVAGGTIRGCFALRMVHASRKVLAL
jgi:hypothetical protein